MVCGEDDECIIHTIFFLQVVKQLSQLKIYISDFAFIGASWILIFERLWRIVPLVGIEAVNPEKPWVLLLLDPIQGSIDDNAGSSLHIRKFLITLTSVIVIVNVESLGQTEPRI